MRAARARALTLGAGRARRRALLTAPAGVVAADPPRTHEVVIQGLRLRSRDARRSGRGDVVVWTNKDPFPHTVTAPGAFDSGSIAAGKSWRFTAKKAGTFDYVCSLHSNMKGTLQVE